MYTILAAHLKKIMDNQITTVTLLLPEEEAKKWLLFQEYYSQFSIMVEQGVFDITNGSATLHFDPQGVLRSITRADILWRS